MGNIFKKKLFQKLKAIVSLHLYINPCIWIQGDVHCSMITATRGYYARNNDAHGSENYMASNVKLALLPTLSREFYLVNINTWMPFPAYSPTYGYAIAQ